MFTAKKLFSFFDYFVTAHAIITKIIGLVYLFGKIILIFVAVWIKFGSEKWSELLVTPILKPCFKVKLKRSKNLLEPKRKSHRKRPLRTR